MKKTNWVYLVICFSIALRVILYFFQTHPIWWDTAVYALIGKYIYSFGQFGLWEPVRPLVFPLLIGLASFFSADAVLIWGFILELAFTAGMVYLSYAIGKEVFDEATGLLASVILSFSPLFFYFCYIPLSDIPSTFFALLSLYFFVKKKDIHAGIFAAVAVMARFPQGIILVSLLLFCFNVKRIIRLSLSFFAAMLPYLALNFLLYSNPLLPFTEGSGVIASAGLWLFEGNWHYYIFGLLKDNMVFIFALAGLAFLRKREQLCIALPFAFFLAYFSFLAHKELRFAIISLPYLSILASFGANKIFKGRKALLAIIALLSVALFFYNIRLERSAEWSENLPFYSFLEGKEANEVLASNPLVGLYSEVKLQPLYYPVFTPERADYWMGYIAKNNPEYIFLDTCSGILCSQDDIECESSRESFGSIEGYEEVFYTKKGSCYHKILKFKKM